MLGAGLATAGLGAMGCGNNAANDTGPTGAVGAGNVSALQVGEIKPISGQPAVIARDATGVYAMTSLCTHQRCDMIGNGSVGSNGLYCSCHGSRFDANGNVLQGPASTPLEHWRVEIAADGSITVHLGDRVDASTRVPVAMG